MLLNFKGDMMKSLNAVGFADWKIFLLFGLMCKAAVQGFLMILDKSFKWLRVVLKKYQMLLFNQSKSRRIKNLKRHLLSLH